MFSCSEKFCGSASSGSTCSSMKARVRRRNSSISGERVKSMPAPPDSIDFARCGNTSMQEGLYWSYMQGGNAQGDDHDAYCCFYGRRCGNDLSQRFAEPCPILR